LPFVVLIQRADLMPPHSESFEMYVSSDLFRKFINAEITNQELVDGFVILFKGSCVKVNLINFS